MYTESNGVTGIILSWILRAPFLKTLRHFIIDCKLLQKALLFWIFGVASFKRNWQKSVSRHQARKILPNILLQSLFQLFQEILWRTKILLMRRNKKVCAIMAHRENFYAPFQKTMRHGANGARQNYPWGESRNTTSVIPWKAYKAHLTYNNTRISSNTGASAEHRH